MTLGELLSLARWAAAMDDSITFTEFEDIKDFAKTCHDLVDVELEDLEIKRITEDIR